MADKKGVTIEEYRSMVLKGKRPKYRNKPIVHDGIRFQSKAEGNRYLDLKVRQKIGDIDYFLMQVPFHLPGNIKYRCDFMVVSNSDDRDFPPYIEFEDVKSPITAKKPDFIRNCKQVKALYGVDIKVVIM